MTTIQVTSRQQAEEVLIQKATEDPAFREELLADPRGAIGGLFGVQLPPNVKITVLEESAREVYLVLPFRTLAADRGQLSDEELARVAGGETKIKELQAEAQEIQRELDEENDVWNKVRGPFGVS